MPRGVEREGRRSEHERLGDQPQAWSVGWPLSVPRTSPTPPRRGAGLRAPVRSSRPCFPRSRNLSSPGIPARTTPARNARRGWWTLQASTPPGKVTRTSVRMLVDGVVYLVHPLGRVLAGRFFLAEVPLLLLYLSPPSTAFPHGQSNSVEIFDRVPDPPCPFPLKTVTPRAVQRCPNRSKAAWPDQSTRTRRSAQRWLRTWPRRGAQATTPAPVEPPSILSERRSDATFRYGNRIGFHVPPTAPDI
jgi:hypothetical protein